jgi:hypothetical protein
MKNLLFLLVLACMSTFAQNKYITKTGTINFEASVPSFEEVAAKNNSVTAIFNTENGEIATLALVKGFRFKNALMEEHFNENYAESDKFPKATFHGKTEPFENISISSATEKSMIKINGAFSAKASDFDIEIPKIVSKKISEDIKVYFQFDLLKK